MALPLGYNLRNLVVRWKVTLLAVCGIALVVAVFVSLLSMSSGFFHALRSTGLPDNAIVTQKGSFSELTSTIQKEHADFIMVDPRIAREEGSEAPLASPEMLLVAGLPHRDTGTLTNVSVRGVTPMAFKVRGGIEVIEGRSFTPGLYEIIVGRQIRERFAGLDIGRSLRIQRTEWLVAGIFSAEGSGFESEIWMDVKVLSQAFNRREMYQSITARLARPQLLESIETELANDPKLQVDVKQERQFYEDQAGPTARVILILAVFVSTIMGIGAVFGGMNTMYAIVAARTREIGTLRALGFSRSSVLAAFLIESVLLALAGAAVGCALAGLSGGMTAATGGPNFSQIAFAFRVTPRDLALGVGFAVLMGLAGGILPAVRAARLPIASALKEG